jgi:hypothetical protein
VERAGRIRSSSSSLEVFSGHGCCNALRYVQRRGCCCDGVRDNEFSR